MGLYKGSNEVAGYQVVDGALSDNSENPVQNKVIASALKSKADTSALDGKADESIISDAYDSTKTYVGGDMFISDNVLYKVKDSVSSVVGQVPPNDTYYEQTNIVEVVKLKIMTETVTTDSSGNFSTTLPSAKKMVNMFTDRGGTIILPFRAGASAWRGKAIANGTSFTVTANTNIEITMFYYE